MAREHISKEWFTEKAERLHIRITSRQLLKKLAEGYVVEYTHSANRTAKPLITIDGEDIVITMIRKL